MNKLREIITRRSVILLILISFFYVLLVAKFGYVMLISRPGQYESAQKSPLNSGLEPPRGDIVDQNGTILATSVRRQSLYANPRRISNPDRLIQRLESVLEINTSKVRQRLRKDRVFVWVKRKVSEANVEKIKDMELSGIGFMPEYSRVYPRGALAGQVLGFVGVDNQGLEGLEKQFNKVLSSVEKTPSDGISEPVKVKLTLDNTIQHIVEDEIKRLAKRESPKGVMGVVMNPHTGAVLAMANWPSFNPNRYWKYESTQRTNSTITHSFEPGSTLKVMTVATGLDYGFIKPESEYQCNGHIYLSHARHTLHCYANHGKLNVPEILIKSCNVGAVKIAQEISSSRYYKSLRGFGFGNWTGIRLPGESKGVLRRPSSWSALTKPTMAIGQGMSLTALQLTSALSALVNGGALMRPRILNSIRRDNTILQETSPFRIRRVISESTSETLRRYMRQVVKKGTGKKARSELFDLAGKTGTAQKANLKEGGYYQDKVLASFIGFGPVGNSKLVAGVFVNEPTTRRYGGEVAAPAFKRIMERSLKYINNSGSESTLSGNKPSLR